MPKIRESNFELLRIVCMFGVFTNHMLQYLYDLHTSEITVANEARMFVMNACIVAVNCFVLISGYFGIRLSVNGIVKFVSQCLFYSLTIFAIAAIATRTFDWGMCIKSVFACSENTLWFVPAYFGLMLVSPMINQSYESMTSKMRSFLLVAFLFVDVYLGYIHQCKEIGGDGFNLFHLMTIYYCGRYISGLPKYPEMKWGLLSIVMFAIMTVLHAVKMRFFPISIIYSLHYQSPCLMISSFFFFQFFRNIKIQSSAINHIASSVFAVYLIHFHSSVFPHLSRIAKSMLENTYVWAEPFVLFFFLLIVFFACIIVDKLRLFLCQKTDSAIVSFIKTKMPELD